MRHTKTTQTVCGLQAKSDLVGVRFGSRCLGTVEFDSNELVDNLLQKCYNYSHVCHTIVRSLSQTGGKLRV